MTLTEYYKENISGAIDVNVCDIILTEKCHVKADVNVELINSLAPRKNLVVVVKKPETLDENDDKYILVTNWAAYELCKRDGIPTVKAIVVNMDRKKFLKTVSNLEITKIVDINTIKIPKAFENTPPRIEKIEVAIKGMTENAEQYLQKCPIVISENNILTDGYTRYLAAKSLGINDINVYKKAKHKSKSKRKLDNTNVCQVSLSSGTYSIISQG